MLEDIVKGDSIELECTCLEATNITGWKIRCEIWNGTESIKKATANSGGSDEQILITSPIVGVFIIKIEKAKTTDFDDVANIEIEVETTDGEVFTVYQDTIKLTDEKITWVTP